MPEDTRYLRRAQPDERFIEENMVFILPDRLRKFRRHLWHVRRNPGPVHVYVPLFRVNTLVASEPLPAGYGAVQDVYPFYTHTTHRRGARWITMCCSFSGTRIPMSAATQLSQREHKGRG